VAVGNGRNVQSPVGRRHFRADQVAPPAGGHGCCSGGDIADDTKPIDGAGQMPPFRGAPTRLWPICRPPTEYTNRLHPSITSFAATVSVAALPLRREHLSRGAAVTCARRS